MAYTASPQKEVELNFLASARYRTFDWLVDDSLAVVDGVHKIVPAGTIYPSNDANAKGVLLHDVDVTEGDRIGCLIVEGYIFDCRIPYPPTNAAINALRKIRWQCEPEPGPVARAIGDAVIGTSLIPG